MGFLLRLVVAVVLFLTVAVLLATLLAIALGYAFRFALPFDEDIRLLAAWVTAHFLAVWSAVWVVKKVVKDPPRKTLAVIVATLCGLSALAIIVARLSSGLWDGALEPLLSAAVTAAATVYMLWDDSVYSTVGASEHSPASRQPAE